MKGFNLKAKLLSAKDRVTGALATGVIVLDAATTSAIESAAETAHNISDAAMRKATGIRDTVTEKVDNTVTAVKDKTNEKLGQLGDAIDTRASKVSAAAAEFGQAAKRKLGGKQEVVAAVEAPKKKAVAKITAKKRKPAAKPAAKKVSR